jgi:hypothetical protein
MSKNIHNMNGQILISESSPITFGLPWVDGNVRKPTKQDSPILVIGKYWTEEDPGDAAVLHWSLCGEPCWRDYQLEAGWEEEDMAWWMPLPRPPGEK